MAQENYIKGFSMQRPPLLEVDGFCILKSHFETYIKSKDINLWQVIQNEDFYFEIQDFETKMLKEALHELLKDEQKKQLGKNNKATMTLYNAQPRKEYERVFMCKTAKGGLLATLPLDKLLGNPKVYEMILENDGVVSKTTTKEKVKSLALKANVTRDQTIRNSICQDESSEDEVIELMVKTLKDYFEKVSRNMTCSADAKRRPRVVNAQDVNAVAIIVVTRITSLMIV
nr:hypothetical protein [Tanacetum cinerariifolium]